MNHAIDELYTQVRNTSGRTAFFGFIGPHGTRMGDNEVVTVPGDLRTILAAESIRGSRKRFDALESALQNELISLDSVPAPIVYDATAGLPLTISVDDGTLGLIDPSYTADQSSAGTLITVGP